MAQHKATHSPTTDALAAHYASGYEAERLQQGAGQLDRERTRELLGRHSVTAGDVDVPTFIPGSDHYPQSHPVALRTEE